MLFFRDHGLFLVLVGRGTIIEIHAKLIVAGK